MADTENRKKPPPIVVEVDRGGKITVAGRPASSEAEVLKRIIEERARRASEDK